jgi:hypothetical protein
MEINCELVKDRVAGVIKIAGAIVKLGQGEKTDTTESDGRFFTCH